LPGNFALSTGAPIAISPDNWSNDFTASSDAGAQEDVSYETEADSIETAQIGTDAHAESPGAGVTDGGARAVSAVSSAGTAAAQSAPAAAAATSAARPAQATRPGRSGNIDQQQSAKVFDQLTNELVITSVALLGPWFCRRWRRLKPSRQILRLQARQMKTHRKPRRRGARMARKP
jgi:hypothetical protein